MSLLNFLLLLFLSVSGHIVTLKSSHSDEEIKNIEIDKIYSREWTGYTNTTCRDSEYGNSSLSNIQVVLPALLPSKTLLIRDIRKEIPFKRYNVITAFLTLSLFVTHRSNNLAIANFSLLRKSKQEMITLIDSDNINPRHLSEKGYKEISFDFNNILDTIGKPAARKEDIENGFDLFLQLNGGTTDTTVKLDCFSMVFHIDVLNEIPTTTEINCECFSDSQCQSEKCDRKTCSCIKEDETSLGYWIFIIFMFFFTIFCALNLFGLSKRLDDFGGLKIVMIHNISEICERKSKKKGALFKYYKCTYNGFVFFLTVFKKEKEKNRDILKLLKCFKSEKVHSFFNENSDVLIKMVNTNSTVGLHTKENLTPTFYKYSLLTEFSRIGTFKNILDSESKNLSYLNINNRLKFCKTLIYAVKLLKNKNLEHTKLLPSSIILFEDVLNSGLSIKIGKPQYVISHKNIEKPLKKLFDFNEDFRFLPPELIEKSKYTNTTSSWCVYALLWSFLNLKNPYEDVKTKHDYLNCIYTGNTLKLEIPRKTGKEEKNSELKIIIEDKSLDFGDLTPMIHLDPDKRKRVTSIDEEVFSPLLSL